MTITQQVPTAGSTIPSWVHLLPAGIEDSRAAVWLLHETGLDEHERVSVTHGRVYVAVSYPGDWFGWSSGERVLLNLLTALAGQASTFELRDLARLDAPTRQAAVLAIGAAYGVFADPAQFAAAAVGGTA